MSNNFFIKMHFLESPTKPHRLYTQSKRVCIRWPSWGFRVTPPETPGLTPLKPHETPSLKCPQTRINTIEAPKTPKNPDRQISGFR